LSGNNKSNDGNDDDDEAPMTVGMTDYDCTILSSKLLE